MRCTMEGEEEIWGRKLLQAVKRYNQLRGMGLNVNDCEFDDFLNFDEEEEEEECGEVAELQQQQKERRRLNTVAQRRVIPEGKVKRILFKRKATVGRKKKGPQAKANQEEKARSHSHRKRRRVNERKSEQLGFKLDWGCFRKGSKEREDICIEELRHETDQLEWCFKRRRLKALKATEDG